MGYSPYLVTMQIMVTAEDLDAADDMGQATVRWAEGFYSAEGRVLDVTALYGPSNLTTAQMKHNLHFAIFGPQEDCERCQAMGHGESPDT